MRPKANWKITRRTDTYIEMTDTNSGAMKQIPLASDKQWGYYESLKQQYSNRPPLKHRPTIYACSKGIEKLLAKKEKDERQQGLGI